MSSTTKLLVPIPEARQDWLGGIGNTTIYDLINKKQLVKVNIGRRSFITAESLAAYVDRLSEAAQVAERLDALDQRTDDPRGVPA